VHRPDRRIKARDLLVERREAFLHLPNVGDQLG
jgi:hypothetical protein